jgi:DNA ligase-1
MLAKKWEDYREKIKYPVFIQPKLDGVRAIYSHQDKFILRNGRVITIPHIKPSHALLDGELYIHGMSLQRINSLIADYRDESAKLEYHVYDVFNTELTFRERLKLFNSVKGDNTVIVETIETDNGNDDIHEYMQDYIVRGYEGIIIRNPDGMYKPGGRSKDLLKYKEFIDAEFEIISYYYGIGKNANIPTFTCRVKKDLTVDVLLKGELEEKRKIDPESYIGKMMTVKFQGYTDDGIPRFPVGLGLQIDR